MNEVVKRLYVNTTMLAPMVRMVSIILFFSINLMIV